MRRLFLLLFLIFSCVHSYAEPIFIAGRDYKVIESAVMNEQAKSGALTVKEFFSYGCPWCYKIERPLYKWKKGLPKKVVFKRVPVVFEAGWDLYAKAYYAADILGVEKRLSFALFREIQVKKEKLESEEAMIQFFINHGISEKVAKSAFLSSPTVDAMVLDGITQMQSLQVNAVPSFVINEHYKVDIAMSEGDYDKMFRVVGFLIAKELVSMLQKS